MGGFKKGFEALRTPARVTRNHAGADGTGDILKI